MLGHMNVRQLVLAALCLCVMATLSTAAQETSAPAGKTVRAVVAIDAAQTGEPISPYIYGQFIEHLGRCIYGGIWAEMLEDRKFYFPVPADGDIWRLTRAQARVLAALEFNSQKSGFMPMPGYYQS